MSPKRELNPKNFFKLPSAITIGSLALVLNGTTDIKSNKGKLQIMAGRLGDIADGIVARKLNMSSDEGAIVDATCDKIGMLAIITSMWHNDIAPKPVLASIVVRQGLNASATAAYHLKHPNEGITRPPKSGKLAMFADNIALSVFMVADGLESETAQKTARCVGYLATGLGTLMGIHATYGYLHGNFDHDTKTVN